MSDVMDPNDDLVFDDLVFDPAPKCDVCDTREAPSGWITIETYTGNALSFDGDENGSYPQGETDGLPGCFCSWAHVAVYSVQLVADTERELWAVEDRRAKQEAV